MKYIIEKEITGVVTTVSKSSINDAWIPQSFCIINENNFVVFFINSTGSKQQAVRFNKDGKIKGGNKTNSRGYSSLGKVNGATYCKLNNSIYVTHSGDYSLFRKKINVLDADTLGIKYTLTLPYGVNGIAFDPITLQFYLSNNKKTYVLPYNELKDKNSKGSKYYSFDKKFVDGVVQDVGGYNGIIMSVHSGTAMGNRIDCYNAKNGSYIGSYKFKQKNEMVSCVCNPSNSNIWTLHYVPHLTEHKAIRTYQPLNIKGDKHPFNNDPVSKNTVNTGKTKVESVSVDKEAYIKKYGNEAKVYFALIDCGISHKAACAIMGNIKQESGFNPEVVNSIGATGLCQWYMGRCTNMKNFNSGETSWKTVTHQIKFLIYELTHSYSSVMKVLKNNSNTLKEMVYSFLHDFEVPGNYDSEMKKRLPNAELFFKRYKNISNSDKFDSSQGTLQVNPDTLYSSDNFKWLNNTKDKASNDTPNFVKNLSKSILQSLQGIQSAVNIATNNKAPETLIKTIENSTVFNLDSNKTLMKSGNITGASLPIAQSLVEAPFVEVTLGDVTFGTYKQRNNYRSYPNYVRGLHTKKVNGSINQYSISLIHQISPGDNPNYIDELISSVGYNEITISYGDANADIIYRDEHAMITDVSTSFDFINCNIQYTINATSLGLMVATNKHTYGERVDKPSNIIRELLSLKELTDWFPGMRDINAVEKMGLIPHNDKKVTIPKMRDMNLLSYIKNLVALMQNEGHRNDKLGKSSYYLILDDGSDVAKELGGAYFKIEEVYSTATRNAFIYEVDIGYPDDNMVFNFSVNENYAWPIAYTSASYINKYNYYLDYNGLLKSNKVTSIYKNFNRDGASNVFEKNLWTQLTEFPITATLTIKGLAAPLLLMTYIKVNCYYYGSKRLTSGIYVVTGQEDILDGNGYKTQLYLTKVIGDEEYETIDGRVIT